MKILVTGACGFLGRNLSERLVACGHLVRAFDVYRAPFVGQDGIEFVEGNLLDGGALARAVMGCDAVVHLACNVVPKTSNANPCLDIENNLCGSVRLLEAAVGNNIKRFVFVSSGGTVYGVPKTLPTPEGHPTNPDCSYGITKLAIEKYIGMYQRERGLSACTLRIANLYGEWQRPNSAQGAVAVFCHKALTGKTIDVWGDGSVIRDYVYVGDAVSSILLALENDKAAGEINIGSGVGTSINELLDAIDSVVGSKATRNYLPGRVFDVPANVLDVSKAKAMLGWQPEMKLVNGIGRTVEWMRSNGLVS